MIDFTLKCVLFHNYVKRLGLSEWKHIAIHQFFFFFIFFLPHLDTVLHFCLMNCQPHCKMLIPSDKHGGKLILPSFNLSLCHVFVRGRSMHIIDIPVACCMTHPSTPLSITHFLSSISPEAESNRAHQTGWSEQNCDWQCPADSPWNSVKPGECTWMRMWTVCAFLCVHLLVYMCTYMHWFLIVCMQACQCIYLPVCVCVCFYLYTSVFLYLSSQLSLPEMKGRRRMTSWKKFFAAWRPERALSAAGLDYWSRRENKFHPFLSSLKLYNIFILNRCMHGRTAMFFYIL